MPLDDVAARPHKERHGQENVALLLLGYISSSLARTALRVGKMRSSVVRWMRPGPEPLALACKQESQDEALGLAQEAAQKRQKAPKRSKASPKTNAAPFLGAAVRN